MIVHLINQIKQDSIKCIKEDNFYKLRRIEFNTEDDKVNIYFQKVDLHITYSNIYGNYILICIDNLYFTMNDGKPSVVYYDGNGVGEIW